MTELQFAVMVDVGVLALCAAVLFRFGRLTYTHPATAYFVFHAFAFTSRAFGVATGADSLFDSQYGVLEPVTTDELSRALGLTDVGLVSATVGWVLAARTKPASTSTLARFTPLNPNIIWAVVALALPIGLWGLYAFARVPGLGAGQVDLGDWGRSGWLSQTSSWLGLCILALVYLKGFRPWLTVPMIGYLLIQSYQGFHRFRVVLPVLALVHIGLDRKGRRWPEMWVVAVLFSIALLFMPLKHLGRMAQEGASFEDFVGKTRESTAELAQGSASDQTFLDQFASTVTLVERSGRYFYGSTYLAVVTLPIPRPWWPNKPGMADHLREFSTDSRPMAEMGMIVTYLGEAFLNFWYFGIVLVPLGAGYGLARIYFRTYERPYMSVARFSYVLVAMNLFQVYRDGLVSLVIFGVATVLPLSAIVIVHLFQGRRACG